MSLQNVSLHEVDSAEKEEFEVLETSMSALSFAEEAFQDPNNLGPGNEDESEHEGQNSSTDDRSHADSEDTVSVLSYDTEFESQEADDFFVNNPLTEDSKQSSDLNLNKNTSSLSAITNETDSASFVKFQVPDLLCRHPPPAVGKDDDIKVLRHILDEALVKSGYTVQPNPTKNKILLAPDHKIANNIFSLMEESKYECLLPEFPVLHLLKSKITNLVSAYKSAGILHLLKYMKDDEEEHDWTKLVTLAQIEGAARNIQRLSLSLHLAVFVKYMESLNPLEAENLLLDMEKASLEEVEVQWNASYELFIKNAYKRNATFCLHLEMMEHCDEIVGIQLSERAGSAQGYRLLLSIVKSSLSFSFLNGASSYASFCVRLLYEHYQAGHFHKCMKECLFTTPHKGFESNFALDAQREMDHRDAIKSFRASSSIDAILQRMSVIDDLQNIQKARNSIYQSTKEDRKSVSPHMPYVYLGKEVTEKDTKFAVRCAKMILRRDALSLSQNQCPMNAYERNPKPLSECILDRNTLDAGVFLIKRFICKMGLAGTNAKDCPSLDDIEGPLDLKRKLK